MRKVVEQISPFDEWYTKYGPEAEVAHFWEGGDSGDSSDSGSNYGHEGRSYTKAEASGDTTGYGFSSWGSSSHYEPGYTPDDVAERAAETERQRVAAEQAAEAERQRIAAEKARTEAIAGIDSVMSGDPNDDRMNDPAVLAAYAKALAGTENAPMSAYQQLVDLGYGKDQLQNGVTVEQTLRSIKTDKFLSENLWPAAKALMSTVPGMGPALAIAEAVKGLATGTQSIGGIAVNTAMSAVAEKLGVNPAVFTNVVNGDFGGAAASYAKSELAGEIASTLGIPRALVNLTMNKSGLNASIDSSVRNFAAEQLGLVKPTDRFTDKVAFGINDMLRGVLPSWGSVTGNVTSPADPTQVSSGGSTQPGGSNSQTEWAYKGSSNVASTENLARNKKDLANFGKLALLDAMDRTPLMSPQQSEDTPNAAQVSLYDWASPLGNKPGLYDWASPLGNKPGLYDWVSPLGNRQAAEHSQNTSRKRTTNTAVPYANMAAGGTVRTEHDDVTDALINILRG